MTKPIFDSKQRKAIAASLDRDGFAVIDFPEPKLDRMAENIIQSLDYLYDWAGWKAGTAASLRLPDAWQFNKNVRRIATNPAIIALLSDLYGRHAFAFQTLNFAVGTQQHIHADLVHFCSRPTRFMCGVWLALEDITDGAGPLIYYPGSHKWPVIMPEDIGVPMASKDNPYEHYHLLEKAWEAQIAERGAKELPFLPKKGQALIWDANLWHGGARQTDMSLTRHSQVTHYFFEGCSYWTPLTGLDRQPVAIEPPEATAAAPPKRGYLQKLKDRLQSSDPR
jgi:ectoine hydroxylase-related dioxygenase (phytanoyl-CoA dioxygenase family)